MEKSERVPCMCVCVLERERERVHVCVCLWEYSKYKILCGRMYIVNTYSRLLWHHVYDDNALWFIDACALAPNGYQNKINLIRKNIICGVYHSVTRSYTKLLATHEKRHWISILGTNKRTNNSDAFFFVFHTQNDSERKSRFGVRSSVTLSP